MAHWIVTANRLSDGGVVYLTAARDWTEDHAAAAATDDHDAAQASLGWAQSQQRAVCDPYVVEVDLLDGVPSPRGARERIRAEGPLPTLRRLGLLRDEPRLRAAVG